MFERDYDLLPRTYSIKGYRKRQSKGIGKIVRYTIYVILISVALSITFFSLLHMS